MSKINTHIKDVRVKDVREPWLTSELIEQMKDKDSLLAKARKSGSEQYGQDLPEIKQNQTLKKLNLITLKEIWNDTGQTQRNLEILS